MIAHCSHTVAYSQTPSLPVLPLSLWPQTPSSHDGYLIGKTSCCHIPQLIVNYLFAVRTVHCLWLDRLTRISNCGVLNLVTARSLCLLTVTGTSCLTLSGLYFTKRTLLDVLCSIMAVQVVVTVAGESFALSMGRCYCSLFLRHICFSLQVKTTRWNVGMETSLNSSRRLRLGGDGYSRCLWLSGDWACVWCVGSSCWDLVYGS